MWPGSYTIVSRGVVYKTVCLQNTFTCITNSYQHVLGGYMGAYLSTPEPKCAPKASSWCLRVCIWLRLDALVGRRYVSRSVGGYVGR